MFARTLALLAASCTTGFAAVSLQDADSLWKFDGAASGTATNAQIIDATGRHTNVTGATNLTWKTNVPANSPAGGTPVDSLGRALSFNPVVTAAGSSTPLPVVNDTVSAATFRVAEGTVSGNFSILTRAMWEGPVPGATGVTPNDAPGNYWLVNNGLSGNGVGSLFGFLGAADGQTARLSYYTSNTTDTTNGGITTGTRSVNSSTGFNVSKGVWYDIGIVVDMGDGNAATTANNTVTFYLYGPDQSVLRKEVFSNMYISDVTTLAPAANAFLTVGAESPGTGTSNQRKTFNGSLDYLAIFDQSLSEAEVLAIFAAPEPTRGFLMMLGLMGLLARRRRA